MSKLAIAEAMPWNLSISVDSILLKNLVLIRLGVFGALPFKHYKKVTVNFCLLRGCGIPIVPTESSRYVRERFLPSAVLLKKLPHFGVVEKQKRF